MLKIVLKDGKIIYSEKKLSEVIASLFYSKQVDLGNGFLVASDGYAYIEQLPINQAKEVKEEL